MKIKPTESEGSRTLILLMTLAYNQVKTAFSELQAEVKYKPMTMFDSGPCDWLVLPLPLPTPTISFSLDHKRKELALSCDASPGLGDVLSHVIDGKENL